MNEDTVKDIFNAFQPNLPASSSYYADCMAARGGSDLVKKMIKRLNNARDDNLRFLFTGHLGCGKSSELQQLARSVESGSTFFPVFIDFEDYLDPYDTTLEDIFLGMFTEIATRCREKFEFSFQLEDYALFKKVGDLVRNFSLKAEGALPFGIAKIGIEQLRQNPSVRRQIRDAISGSPAKSLFFELNMFVKEVEQKLSAGTEFRKLVIIADSLEKVTRFEGSPEGLESQKRLFVDRVEQMTGIATNVIYTLPLSLYRSHFGTQLPQLYGRNVFVLPMVKVFKRGRFGEPFELGVRDLTEIVKKRLRNAGTTLEDTITNEALSYLLLYSGGHIRSLIRFIQEAIIATDEFPISLQTARESVREDVRGFAASVREEFWQKLAKLENSAKQQIENGDDDYSKMLESLAILEYLNGDETDSDDDVWYAVNPAIRLTNKFKAAIEAITEENGDPKPA